MTNTYDCVIEQIVQSIFSTMLDMEVVRAEGAASPDDNSLLAAIQIAGAWTGSVVLHLSDELATESTATMLQMLRSDVTDLDRRDVAAELVNMIGGNLKSLLPGPSFLSLPTIVVGQDVDLQIQDAEIVDEVALISSSGTALVRVFTKAAAPQS